MKYTKTQTLGTTAIAAVLALSATPALAQDTAAPATEETSIVTAPASDPLAPELEAVTSSEPTAMTAPSKPKAKALPAKKVAPVQTAARAPARLSTPVQSEVSPSQVADLAAPPAVEATIEPVAPVAVEPAPTAQAALPDGALPAAGVGLGALALAGLGMAIRRRRRDEDEQEIWLEEQPRDEFSEPRAPARRAPVEFATVAPVNAAPLAAKAQNLPKGFDLSRHSPRVQAAYRGPTADNPSVSMKKRVKMARVLDQRERLYGKAAPVAKAMPVADRPVMSQFKPARIKFGQPKNEPAFQY